MLTRMKPEAAGVRSEGIVRFLDDMREKHLHLHDMMILRHGAIIAEASFPPWSKDDLHVLFSLSKSFTSTAVGFAVQDGLLRVSDKLVDFFPEHLPAGPCENMKKITIKHLLTMNTGHAVEPARVGECWERDFLRSYVEYAPGTHFLYNTSATYMLAAIVQKVTGKKLLAYLREKLMDPLNMSEDIWFEESPTGVATGGYGLNVRVMDVAKLGQFYLQGGMWEGQQLLDRQWVLDAQKPWSDNSDAGAAVPDAARGTNAPSDWACGYGYQFWICSPEGVYRGDGAFGQYCVIMPKQDMVIAINSGVEDMQAVLTSIWENILPCVGEPCESTDILDRRLVDTTTRARWEDMERGVADPTIDPAWVGRYTMQKDDALGLTAVVVRPDALVLCYDGIDNIVPLCRDIWQPVQLKHGAQHPDPWVWLGYLENAAARAARRDDALVLHLCYTNTPFEDILKFTFTPHGIRVKGHRNVSFDGTQFDLIGYRE